MASEVVVVIDEVAPVMISDANLNKRHHWAKKNVVTSYWRTRAALAVLPRHRSSRLGKSRVTVTIFWPDAKKRDAGNWAPLAKACVDGLVDVGVFADDNNDHVVGPDLRAGKGHPMVKIEITSLEEADGQQLA